MFSDVNIDVLEKHSTVDDRRNKSHSVQSKFQSVKSKIRELKDQSSCRPGQMIVQRRTVQKSAVTTWKTSFGLAGFRVIQTSRAD